MVRTGWRTWIGLFGLLMLGSALLTAGDSTDKKDKEKTENKTKPYKIRILMDGELLQIKPGEDMMVEISAQPARRIPTLDYSTNAIVWYQIPPRPGQQVLIRWLGDPNKGPFVALVEMIEGDLVMPVVPRPGDPVTSVIRGKKTSGKSLAIRIEVDASLQITGYGFPGLPGTADTSSDSGLRVFVSLNPGKSIQNAGKTHLVVQTFLADGADGSKGALDNTLLPIETSLIINGSKPDPSNRNIPTPGSPGGPTLILRVSANEPKDRILKKLLIIVIDRPSDASPSIP